MLLLILFGFIAGAATAVSPCVLPVLSDRFEGYMSRLTSRFQPKTQHGKQSDGFWSGTLIGGSLGLVYAPCAGPILAGVITVSASQAFTAGRLAVAISYGIGSALVLYLLVGRPGDCMIA
jgi:cytochrome c biogenesis protein CcdA